jgi:hypothetical protein
MRQRRTPRRKKTTSAENVDEGLCQKMKFQIIEIDQCHWSEDFLLRKSERLLICLNSDEMYDIEQVG